MLALYGFLNLMDFLSNVQCGFRQGRNTLDHLVRFETFIWSALAKKEHDVFIFFDLQKYMTQHGNMAFQMIFLIWGWKVSYLLLFRNFYLIENLIQSLFNLF